MTSPIGRKLLLAGCALALAGCGGGGGGGGVASLPRPQPAPTPAPVTVPAAIIPTVTQSTNFAALGLEAAGNSADLAADGFAVAFDSSTGLYVMDFPSTEPGGFLPGPYPLGDIWSGNLLNNGTIQDSSIEVLNPANPAFPLTYTGLAGYLAGGSYGWVAFGVETAPGAVPVNGTASYDAIVRGYTVDAVERISGDAALTFDFGAGTLSGHMSPILFSDYDWGTYELGRYDFVNTIFGAGSTTFSGEFSHSIFGQSGNFNGMFTGPAAQELIASWTAPYRHPLSNADSTMFGVLVGRR